jgi:hypothetical protein
MDGAAANVDRGCRRFHEQADDDVARDRGQRVHAGEEHEHRGHQRPAAHPGQSDDDPDGKATDDERELEIHRALDPIGPSGDVAGMRTMIPSAFPAA